MYGVVRPVAESILPKSALSGKSGGPVTTGATRSANTTDTAHTTHATGPTHTASATDTTDSTRPTRATYTADTTCSAGPAHATYTAAHTTDTAYTTHATGPTHTSQAAGDGVAIEAVEVVDINIATAPAATPAPTTAPPRSHQHSRAEGDRGTRGVVAGRIVKRRIWIHRLTVYGSRLISRHVDNFRIGRLYHDHALVFNYSRFHCLLLGGVQSALVLCLPAHALNGIHQLALLRQEGIAEISSPLNVISQQFHDFW